MNPTTDIEYEAWSQKMLKEAEQEEKYWAEAQAEIDAHNEEYRKKYPNHCKCCGGWGVSSYVEMHGFTHGCGETIVDPCSCVEEGKCPQCGAEDALGEEGEGPCPHCGWNYDNGIRTL